MKSTCCIFSLLIGILLLASCTIEKRLHQPGWHVEWKKQLPAADCEEAVNGTASTDETVSAIRPNEAPIPADAVIDERQTTDTEINFPSPEAVAQDAVTSPVAAACAKTVPVDDTLKRKVIVINESELPGKRSLAHNETGKRDPLTIALWTLCGLSLLAIIVCAVLLLGSTGELFIAGFLVAELVFSLMTRVFMAVLILHRERKYPGMYRESRNLFLAVLLPELVMLFAVLITIGVAILAF